MYVEFNCKVANKPILRILSKASPLHTKLHFPQDDPSVLRVTWQIEDAQSGIDHFEIVAYELSGTILNEIYPQA